MNNNSWNKKEKPLQALSGLGGGLAQPHVYSHKFSATGGTMVTPGNGSTYHVFTSNGTFTVEGSGEVEFLVIAGGGSGNNSSVVEAAVFFIIRYEFNTGSYPTSIGGSYNLTVKWKHSPLHSLANLSSNGSGGSAMRQLAHWGSGGGGGWRPSGGSATQGSMGGATGYGNPSGGGHDGPGDGQQSGGGKDWRLWIN